MKYFKRALINLKRHLGKTLSLFVILLILGSLISGAISIRQAIISAENHLRIQLPAVSTINSDSVAVQEYLEETGDFPNLSFGDVSVSTINEIGNLPYVRSHGFSLRFFGVTRGLKSTRFLNIDLEQLSPGVTVEELQGVFSYINDGTFDNFLLRGIHQPELIEIESGMISLLEGDLLTQEQIESGAQIAIISSDFAEVNNLQLGDAFTITSTHWDYNKIQAENPFNPVNTFDEAFIFSDKPMEFTVGSIFEVVQEFDYSSDPWITANMELQARNQIFVPNKIVEEFLQFDFDSRSATLDMSHIPADSIFIFDNAFLLEDPRDFESFVERANELLPEFWAMDDLSNQLGIFTSALDSLLWIADIILWVSVGTTLVIVFLLVSLYLRDRRSEIGLYLALGERKIKILLQIFMELLPIVIVSLTLALFIGNLFSGGLSRQMLETQMLERQQEVLANVFLEIPHNLRRFVSNEMSVESMIRLYDTSLSHHTVAIFYFVGLATTVIAATVPLIKTLRVDPKKILM
ncbi:MAG: ABC transporter permease [Turicibacter sp.]|nr:ABC transporter permease [Turicibacter sp.]